MSEIRFLQTAHFWPCVRDNNIYIFYCDDGYAGGRCAGTLPISHIDFADSEFLQSTSGDASCLLAGTASTCSRSARAGWQPRGRASTAPARHCGRSSLGAVS